MGIDNSAANSRCFKPDARRSSRISLIADVTMPFMAPAVQRPPARMTGDQIIQMSYSGRTRFTTPQDHSGKLNARNVAQNRKTGHFFRFVFA